MTEAAQELLLLLAAKVAGDPGDPAVYMNDRGGISWTDPQTFREQLFDLMRRVREGK